MVVNSKFTVKIHIFSIHLLISGAQYIIGTLINQYIKTSWIPRIVRISSKLSPTLHTFDICIYQSSSCVTTKYLAYICSS